MFTISYLPLSAHTPPSLSERLKIEIRGSLKIKSNIKGTSVCAVDSCGRQFYVRQEIVWPLSNN